MGRVGVDKRSIGFGVRKGKLDVEGGCIIKK